MTKFEQVMANLRESLANAVEGKCINDANELLALVEYVEAHRLGDVYRNAREKVNNRYRWDIR